MRPKTIQQRAAKANLAMGGMQKTGENVECGGIPGPVGADEADDLAIADREVQVGKSHEAAEIHGEALDRENDLARWFRSGIYWAVPRCER